MEWRDVKGYEGEYQVSDTGLVKTLARKDARGYQRKEKIMKTYINRRGYETVNLNKNRCKVIHRLMAEAFLDKPEGKTEVNHINGIKTDNRLSNLEWVTHAENMLHACRSGLRHTAKGEFSCRATLTNEQAREVRKLRKLGWTQQKIAEHFGVSRNVVFGIVRNETYINAGGF